MPSFRRVLKIPPTCLDIRRYFLLTAGLSQRKPNEEDRGKGIVDNNKIARLLHYDAPSQQLIDKDKAAKRRGTRVPCPVEAKNRGTWLGGTNLERSAIFLSEIWTSPRRLADGDGDGDGVK